MYVTPETAMTACAGAYALWERFKTRKQIKSQTESQTITILSAITDLQRNVVAGELSNRTFRAYITSLNLVPNLAQKVEKMANESLDDRNSLRERIVKIELSLEDMKLAVQVLSAQLEDCKKASGEIPNT